MLTTLRTHRAKSTAKWEISPVKRIGANNEYTIRDIQGKGLVTAPGKNSYTCYDKPGSYRFLQRIPVRVALLNALIFPPTTREPCGRS